MPKKTKEIDEKEEKSKVKKSTTKKKTTSTKTAAKKASAKSTSAKKSSSTKKASTTTRAKKSSTKATTKKATTSAKKSSTKTTRKRTTKKADVDKIIIEPVEYYDLPYRYNQTIVKLLAQTPTSLFIYWDISDEDRANLKEKYGDNFFEVTKPVLVVHNRTLDYSFEVDINDFANSWYLHVNDSKCDYNIELGRRPITTMSNDKNTSKINTDYIYISSSNDIESPNDRILFNDIEHMVYFRNVKNNVQYKKDISSISFITNMGKIYNIYDLYQKLYKDEDIDGFNNVSSSKFK